MAAKDFIVAIELGSSKVTGIAGQKNLDGSINVLAMVKEESSSFVHPQGCGLQYRQNRTMPYQYNKKTGESAQDTDHTGLRWCRWTVYPQRKECCD